MPTTRAERVSMPSVPFPGLDHKLSRVAPPAMSMEVWSEKNIRLTLPLGVALPLAGLVTPPDSFGASVLPVAIAALWIFIFVDLLKAAVPQDDFDF